MLEKVKEFYDIDLLSKYDPVPVEIIPKEYALPSHIAAAYEASRKGR